MLCLCIFVYSFFFFKQKTAYEMRISDWSSDVCSSDLHLRSVGDPQISPDGTRALFTVRYADRIGMPYTRIWQLDLASGATRPWGSAEGVEGGDPRFSPDGGEVAYLGDGGLIVAAADGSGARRSPPVDDTNHPPPRMGARFAWSPDGPPIALKSGGGGNRR